MSPKLLIPLTMCAALGAAASGAAAAAGPPPPLIIVPDTTQALLQTQIQQAQAQARMAATQARVQAELDANQARLQGELAANRARTQLQLEAASGSTAAATAARLTAQSMMNARPMPEPPGNPNGTMQLATLTPQLGSYFGTDHGVLVLRAPTHGVLKLQDGDVILSIGDRTPSSGSQAIRILTSYDPGEKIDMVVLRQHRRVHITATMSTPPAR